VILIGSAKLGGFYADNFPTAKGNFMNSKIAVLKMNTKILGLVASLGFLGGLALAAPARADIVTVNFDALNASAGAITGASLTSYLAGFGITLTESSGTSVSINDVNLVYGGGVIGATTGNNVLMQGGPAGPASYTLSFATALLSFQFDTVSNITYNSLPAWSATAYDASNVALSNVGNPYVSTGGAAQTFLLNGPGIESVTFYGNAEGFAGFTNQPIDTLVLTTPVPEPSTWAMMLLGFAGIGFMAYRRKSAAIAA
jgi:PEP-CTERM motif